MILRRFVPWFTRIALVALSITTGFVGCSRQSEGDRCDKEAAGDTDCNDGLVCVTCEDLRSGSIDRCCPPNPADASDPDCARADPPRTNASECKAATGGTGGLGFGGFAGRAGAGGGGMSGGGMSSGGTSGTGDSGGEAGAAESGSGGT
jgi:hypothetical protein